MHYQELPRSRATWSSRKTVYSLIGICGGFSIIHEEWLDPLMENMFEPKSQRFGFSKESALMSHDSYDILGYLATFVQADLAKTRWKGRTVSCIMAAKTDLSTWQGSVKRGGWREQRHIDMSLFSSLVKWEDMKATDHVEINSLYLVHSLYVERVKPLVSSVNNWCAKNLQKGRAATFFSIDPVPLMETAPEPTGHGL